ncbi:MAG: hypothetical protein EXX96DRAFT_576025 [Benjaminiella poitrasii]|nr:MAG: hypothetical protein EXX96DRAFT_576025 [Benjaminiella poitrasii]
MLPNEYKSRPVRPMSEIINPGHFMSEADIAGNWYEDLQNYERNLDEMASATLDQNFKEEMQHVDQWYRYLTEAEKTATMYTLLQHSSQVQARFFINLLQQMLKRDPLFSLLTPNNPDQEMQNHLAGAMAKAELEASQRLMSVLPYKTGQVISRPQSSTVNRRTVDRHSFALGDTEEYSRLFGAGRASNDLLNTRSPYVSSILDDSAAANTARRLSSQTSNRTSGRAMFNSSGRPHSVIEGDATASLFPPSTVSWMNTTSSSSSSTGGGNANSNTANTLRRQPAGVGHIGDRGSKLLAERPKSADISNWTLPTTDPLILDRRASSNNANNTGNSGYVSVWGAQPQPPSSQQPQQLDNDLIDFTNSLQQQPFRRRAAVNRIPVLSETDELVRTPFLNDTNNRVVDPHFRNTSSSNTSSTNSNSNTNTNSSINNNGLNDHYTNYLINVSAPQSFQGIAESTAALSLDDVNDHGDHLINTAATTANNFNLNNAANNNINSRANKDKKAVEVVDMELLKDVPAWLRSLRLHKYNTIFSDCTWQEIVKMSDDDLLKKGVAALGARRKMLKVFENIKAHCEANNIPY